jgi:hypothetical protein
MDAIPPRGLENDRLVIYLAKQTSFAAHIGGILGEALLGSELKQSKCGSDLRGKSTKP